MRIKVSSVLHRSAARCDGSIEIHDGIFFLLCIDRIIYLVNYDSSGSKNRILAKEKSSLNEK